MATSEKNNGPRLSFCMIVKDEEEVLSRCLESVKELVDEIIVVDTGSTDRTIEIAREFGAKVIETEWVDDFSAVRNIGFDAASGDWILWLDADEELESGAAALIREAIKDPEPEGYLVTIENLQGEGMGAAPPQTFPSPRLVRNRPKHRFTGIVHEQIQFDEAKSGSLWELPAKIIHYGYLDAAKEAGDKNVRNQALLDQSDLDDEQKMILEADTDMEAGRIDEALSKYIQAFEALEAADLMNMPGVVLKIIVGFRMKKDWQEALVWAGRGLKRWPDYTDIEYLRALTYMELSEHDEAISSLTACVLLGDPPATYDTQPGVGSWLAWQGLGLAYVGLVNEFIALRAFTQALHLNPRDAMSAGNLGEIYLNSGSDPKIVKEELAKITEVDAPEIQSVFQQLFGDET